ncbi:MAG: hypothetical protein KAZ11_00345 [Chitinophagaceae bacterium]|nr:hypothetical protein [Chitinophagaceae bacterium]
MENTIQKLEFPLWVRICAKVVSYVFHPLFVGVMMAAYLIFIHPYFFVGFSEKQRMLKLLAVINNNLFFPLIVVALLRALGFNKSLLLQTQKERIVPYLASITFFFWSYYVFKNQPEVPRVLVYMCRGMFISAAIALVLNNNYKISMHGIGVGGLMGLMTVILFEGQLDSGLPYMIAVLISGAVMSARKIVSDHHWFDIITGFFLGFCTQLIALWV